MAIRCEAGHPPGGVRISARCENKDRRPPSRAKKAFIEMRCLTYRQNRTTSADAAAQDPARDARNPPSGKKRRAAIPAADGWRCWIFPKWRAWKCPSRMTSFPPNSATVPPSKPRKSTGKRGNGCGRWAARRRAKVSPQLLERYAVCSARWIQCEEMTNRMGFLSKHPTTQKPIPSPFINIGINYMNQAVRLWNEFPRRSSTSASIT